MFNPGGEPTNFYLCVIHAASNTVIWSANGNASVSEFGKMSLTRNGISITDQYGNFKWSTLPLKLPVFALQLTEHGNLILLNQFNDTLWESFDYPTDTIVIGQNLPVGKSLSSAASNGDLSIGDYKLVLGASDTLLQWQNITYWKLSMDSRAYTNSNYVVEYMAINQTGLYLFAHDATAVVIMVNLSPSEFRIAKLDASGQLIIGSFSGTSLKQEFVGPSDKCQIPLTCGKLGLCSDTDASNGPVCSCPSNFHASSQHTTDCVPSDDSHSLPVSCHLTDKNNKQNSTLVSYLGLGYGIDYFANDFTTPIKYGVNLSVCQYICSSDCLCLGVFYENSSESCYVLQNKLGSLMLSTGSNNDRIGFIKTLLRSSTPNYGKNNNSDDKGAGFPLVALVLLPFTGMFLVVALGLLWWRRSGIIRTGKLNLACPSSPSSGDLEAFSIPGLPIRFEYVELEEATDNFRTQIGSGGFGAVYKGTLPDNSLVAVKKITNFGVQGKKDFCTEIAIIGNIHHVNLVKLRGFCAQGRERLLVYEYMNRGSLDRTLFGSGPVLEWQERVDIAIGTARGLAYLHTGCQQKIIHCDVKPENILLHDHFQAKISDFGLSKLLSSEQSSLFTTMRGTRGYLAPEWLTSSAISDKTDVYSFGMVLLEIVSGRKNCSLRTQTHSNDDDNSGGGNSLSSSEQGLVYFPLFALEMHEQGRYLELADPRLEGRVTSAEVEKFVCVALCCVHEEPALRPNMVTVVSMLEGKLPFGRPRMESLNFLRFYGRRFTEASTIEDNNWQDDYMLHPQANASLTSTKSSSPIFFSYISSQQISGPR
ncbi:G-type lectin S-receptor-like serine/threonine-protein kinase At5g35370 isoform X2 [Diospyros lotus]|nr:G-type lectin S-receptor-like serine/threonine-protein kinase At5g35370 isoform X2 [Diospyros lotus]XP_052203757.1 G-type lectin S-receptor-like serine/threonine-protein kinase At5g35370 isoform X2 [Diospyros lotus]XP_052203758.1 G-type lectin S-receptor-like serine/threonine-protein kinase At5g35370 isoform X2 [Diospyros lotus]